MYLIDTNVFIQISKAWPPEDFVPLWEWFGTNQIGARSIKAVYDEIAERNHGLHGWATDMMKKGFLLDHTTRNIERQARKVRAHVRCNYPEHIGTRKFLDGADFWLVASAMELNRDIITNEVPAGPRKTKPKIPDVAGEFEICCCKLSEVFERHGIDLSVPSGQPA